MSSEEQTKKLSEEEKKKLKEEAKLEKEKKKQEKALKLQGGGDKNQKNKTGVAFPKSNISSWYPDVLIKSELIDYYDISGCYIFRPWSFKMWELIQESMNKEFSKLGVQNCYFPLFVTKEALESEAEHVEFVFLFLTFSEVSLQKLLGSQNQEKQI
jgi:hypothetical protein